MTLPHVDLIIVDDWAFSVYEASFIIL